MAMHTTYHLYVCIIVTDIRVYNSNHYEISAGFNMGVVKKYIYFRITLWELQQLLLFKYKVRFSEFVMMQTFSRSIGQYH